jgi:hypothetical protein
MKYSLRSFPIDCAPLYHVEGLLTRDAFTWRVTAGSGGKDIDAPATWAGCEVRVRATCAASERQVIDLALVRAPFAEAARCDVELVALPDRGLRAPAVAIARTLAEKLVAWAEASGQEPRVSALGRLGQLEHADAGTMLAALTQELTALEAPTTTDREVAA